MGCCRDETKLITIFVPLGKLISHLFSSIKVFSLSKPPINVSHVSRRFYLQYYNKYRFFVVWCFNKDDGKEPKPE